MNATEEILKLHKLLLDFAAKILDLSIKQRANTYKISFLD